MEKPYPPAWRDVTDNGAVVALLREYPFAHLITGGETLLSTRVPFLVDTEDGAPARLRTHINGNNPQAAILPGAEVLVVFSGPYTYVSPNWRTEPSRGATFDYQEVRIRGTAKVEPDRQFFVDLVDELARQIEPYYSEVGDYPVWQSSMTPDEYIDRLHPHILALSIEISAVEMISKLHQPFPPEDRKSVADHLAKSDRSYSRKIAEAMRALDS